MGTDETGKQFDRQRRKASVSYALALNSGRTCSVPGCQKPRYKLSSNCRRHADHKRKWGSVHGKQWSRCGIKKYVPAAERFLQLNHDHKAIVLALAWLTQVSREAAVLYSDARALDPTTKSLAKLHFAGRDSLDILTDAIAVTYYYCDVEPEQSEQAVYVRNIAAFVLGSLKPAIGVGAKKTLYSTRLGGFLWGGLRLVLVGVVAHKMNHDRQAKQMAEATKIPFV
jgi:hypothetical protein